jgi:hypothetical protein
VGLSVGILFLGIGLVMIPKIGAFGVLWTIGVLIMVGYYAVNLFSEEGIAHEVIDVETSEAPGAYPATPARAPSTEQRLLDLDDLKLKGLITEGEYVQQRKRILDGI